MNQFLFVVSLSIVLVNTGKAKGRQLKQAPNDLKSEATHPLQIPLLETGHTQKKYSGSELASIAHNSALQAKAAVQSQDTAGSQADFNAKSSLAQAALGAAATAQAALVGKQVMVQSLEHEMYDMEQQLIAELSHFQQIQKAAVAAHQAEQQAKLQVDALAAALASAQESAQGASNVASKSAGTVASQQSMIQHSKQMLSQVSNHLHNALGELHQTELSAKKAAEATQIAQANAAEAANSIAIHAERNLVKKRQSHNHHNHTK